MRINDYYLPPASLEIAEDAERFSLSMPSSLRSLAKRAVKYDFSKPEIA
jgi:hypothetical protein